MGKAKPIEPAPEQQPALFADGDLPTCQNLVEACKSYVHSGKTTCRDQERAQAIVQHYLESGSLLATARRFTCSPNTIKAVLAILEQAGKLDDLKQRVSSKLGIVAELATDRSIEMLQNGTVPANVLPIMLGVAVEKKALLDGEATQRVEAAVVSPVEANDVLTYLRSKGLPAPAIDVPSTVSSQNPQENKGNP